MPIYEYECDDCGRVEEVLQNFSDAPLQTCRNCSGKVHKIVSQSSFHLKGTGWYVTDYSKKSRTSPPAKNSDTAQTADSGSAKKAAAPAAKTEASGPPG